MNTVNDARWNPFRRHALGSMAEETDPTAPPLASMKSKTWETTIERVESWPEEARPLKKHNWLSYLYGIGDFLLVLLPIYFIRKYSDAVVVLILCTADRQLVLGVAVITLNGKPTRGSDFGKKVEFAMDLVSYIYGPAHLPTTY
jgi:hypothetical protein